MITLFVILIVLIIFSIWLSTKIMPKILCFVGRHEETNINKGDGMIYMYGDGISCSRCGKHKVERFDPDGIVPFGLHGEYRQ